MLSLFRLLFFLLSSLSSSQEENSSSNSSQNDQRGNHSDNNDQSDIRLLFFLFLLYGLFGFFRIDNNKVFRRFNFVIFSDSAFFLNSFVKSVFLSPSAGQRRSQGSSSGHGVFVDSGNYLQEHVSHGDVGSEMVDESSGLASVGGDDVGDEGTQFDRHSVEEVVVEFGSYDGVFNENVGFSFDGQGV